MKHNNVISFLETADVMFSEIVYVDKRHNTEVTIFHLNDGRELTRYVAIKDVFCVLPHDKFTCINKGLIVNKDYIKKINGIAFHVDVNGKDVRLYGRMKGVNQRNALKTELGV